jgi:hypothetical protein
LNSAGAAAAGADVAAAGASVALEAAGAAVGAVPPQAERAMLAMTRRLSKANILRIFLLLKNLESFELQIYSDSQRIFISCVFTCRRPPPLYDSKNFHLTI